MAQTLEEIAELLKKLKLDTEVSATETERVLAGINSKMDSIADDYAANQLLKDYLVDLKQELLARHDFNVNKYTEFEQAFSVINNAQKLAVTGADLDDLIQKLDKNLDSVKVSIENTVAENLQNVTNELGKINSNLDSANHELSTSIAINFDAVSDKVEDLSAILENLKSLLIDSDKNDELMLMLNSLKNTLDGVIDRDNFDAFRNDLSDFLQKIVDNANFLNSDVVENKDKLEHILQLVQSSDFTDKLSEITHVIEEIRTDSIKAVTTGMNEVSAKIDDLSFDFHQKTDESMERIADAILTANTKLDFLHNYLANDVPDNLSELKEMSESLKVFVEEINENCKTLTSESEEKSIERLGRLESAFSDCIARYYEKMSDLKSESENFNRELSEVLNGKTDGVIAALEPLKNGLQEIISYDFGAIFEELKEQVEQVYNCVHSQMHSNNEQNQTFVQSLDKLYNDTMEKINSVNETITLKSQGNQEVIQSVLAEVNQTLERNLSSNSQLLQEWKSLLTSIDEKVAEMSTNTNDAFSNIAVNVTNALNSKLGVMLEEIKDHMGVPVTADDLVLSMDNLKNDLTLKLAHLSESSPSKNDVETTKSELTALLTQLNTKVDELGLRYSNEEFNEIIDNNKMHIMSGLKELKNIILTAMKEVAKSSVESMNVMHEKLDALLDGSASSALSDKIDEKTEEIISRLEALNSNPAREETLAELQSSYR